MIRAPRVRWNGVLSEPRRGTGLAWAAADCRASGQLGLRADRNLGDTVMHERNRHIAHRRRSSMLRRTPLAAAVSAVLAATALPTIALAQDDQGGRRGNRRDRHAARAEHPRHPDQHRELRRQCARNPRDHRSRRARPQRAGAVRRRSGQAIGEPDRRARLEPHDGRQAGSHRQQRRQCRLHLCRRHPALRRSGAERHAARRSVARAAGHVVRLRYARRRDPLLAEPARSSSRASSSSARARSISRKATASAIAAA